MIKDFIFKVATPPPATMIYTKNNTVITFYLAYSKLI